MTRPSAPSNRASESDAVDLDAVLLEHALEEAARPPAPYTRSNVTSSCITIEHFLPRAVSVAATSQPMNEPPIITTCSASDASAAIASDVAIVRR